MTRTFTLDRLFQPFADLIKMNEECTDTVKLRKKADKKTKKHFNSSYNNSFWSERRNGHKNRGYKTPNVLSF